MRLLAVHLNHGLLTVWHDPDLTPGQIRTVLVKVATDLLPYKTVEFPELEEGLGHEEEADRTVPVSDRYL